MCSRLPGYNVVFPVRAFPPVIEGHQDTETRLFKIRPRGDRGDFCSVRVGTVGSFFADATVLGGRQIMISKLFCDALICLVRSKHWITHDCSTQDGGA